MGVEEYLGVLNDPDPKTSAKYCDANGSRIVIHIGGVYDTFCQEEGIVSQKHRDGNRRCIAILFKSIGVRGRCASPEIWRKELQSLALVGLRTQTPNAAFFERKGPERKP